MLFRSAPVARMLATPGEIRHAGRALGADTEAVLEALAADCAADGRYDCMFTSAPLNLPQGVASPPNALAIK